MLKRHFFTSEGDTAFQQTKLLFKKVKPYFDEIIRTWIYIKDIDNNYEEVSNARNEFFDEMNFEEPYFASTGIGKPDDQFYKGELVHLDILIVPNLNESLLYPMENLSVMPHTKDYGVRFERGIIYENRKIISGTASIDKDGNVMHKGDIIKQTYQALYNINKLLNAYGSNIYNATEITGYVRNPNDIDIVKSECDKIYHSCKWNIIEGKVCRPDWLVEFELMI